MNFVDRDVVRELGVRFDPLQRRLPAGSYPFSLSQGREMAPAFYCDAIGHWVVTRHADIKGIYPQSAEFFRAERQFAATRGVPDGF